MRYITQGAYIIDSTNDVAICKAIAIKGVNLLADAEIAHAAKNMACIICAAMNMYNEQQGGI